MDTDATVIRALATIQPGRYVTVDHLRDALDTPTEADVASSTDQTELRSWWKHAHLQDAIKARVDELKAEGAGGSE